MQKTRPEWLDEALERHAPKTERDKQRTERAQLQAALTSARKQDRDAARAEIAAKVEAARPDRTPPAKKR